MIDFLQQNWIGVLFVVAMLAMHLGGHRHGGQGGHAGHGGSMSGCGGHPVTRPHDHASQAGSTTPPAPSPVQDPTRDANSPDPNQADSQGPSDTTQPVSGASIEGSRHRHGC